MYFNLHVKNLYRFNFKYSFKNWIRKIAVNTCLDKIKSTKSRIYFLALEDSHGSFEVEKLIELDNTKPILTVHRQLPPRYRVVFKLYVFEEYKHKEIAEILSFSECKSTSNYVVGKTKNVLSVNIN